MVIIRKYVILEKILLTNVTSFEKCHLKKKYH